MRWARFDEPYLNFPEDLLFVKVLQPSKEIGRKAVDLTLSRIESKLANEEAEGPARILLSPEILSLGPPTRTGHTLGS